MSQNSSADGTSLFYRDTGGFLPAIVLIHGFANSLQSFRLLGPGGCPWDVEQNFRTIAPYTIEEAYEVADAIERGEDASRACEHYARLDEDLALLRDEGYTIDTAADGFKALPKLEELAQLSAQRTAPGGPFPLNTSGGGDSVVLQPLAVLLAGVGDELAELEMRNCGKPRATAAPRPASAPATAASWSTCRCCSSACRRSARTRCSRWPRC